MNILKQSTAVTIKAGPFLDDTDGKSAETGLSIAQADVRLSKNGGANAQKNSSTATAHNELGYYNVHLSETDTNTLGALKVMVSKEGALPVWADFMVVHAKVYDAMFSTGTVEALPVKLHPEQDGVEFDGDIEVNGQVKIVANVADEGAFHVENIHENGFGNYNGGMMGQTNQGSFFGQLNIGPTQDVKGHDPAIPTVEQVEMYVGNAMMGAIGNIQGDGWDGETLKAIYDVIDAIKGKTDNLPASPAATGDIPSDSDIATAVWGAVTRTLTSGIITAQDIWEHASRTLTESPTDVSDLPTKDDLDTAKDAVISAMPNIDLSTIPDDILDTPIVDTLTVGQVLKVLAAIELGTVAGGGTSSFTYEGKDGTKVTLSGVDESGNRGVVNVEFED